MKDLDSPRNKKAKYPLFNLGNIVQSPYKTGLEIVIRVEDHKDGGRYYNTIPFDKNNCIIGHFENSYMEELQCFCNEDYWIPEHNDYDPECSDCKGTGYYMKERCGMDKFKLVGSNMKDYIIKSLTKNFNF